MKVITIETREQKNDTKGQPFLNFKCQVEHGGQQRTAYIGSYVGEIYPGQELPGIPKEKTSARGGNYLSLYLHADDNRAENYARPATPSAPPSFPQFTPPVLRAAPTPAPVYQAPAKTSATETEQIMDRCIDYGIKAQARLSDAGIDTAGFIAIINTMFIEHHKQGHKPADWTNQAAPIIGGQLKNELHWKITDLKNAGKIKDTDIMAQLKLSGHGKMAWDNLTDAEAQDMHDKLAAFAAPDVTTDTGFNSDPVQPPKF